MKIGNVDITANRAIVALAVLVQLQGGIGHGAVSLTNMVPAGWIESIVAWNNFLAYVGTAIMGAVALPGAINGRQLVPSVPTVVKVLIAAFALSLFLPMDRAQAQVKLGPVGTKIKADIDGATQNTAVGAPPPTIKPLELIQKIAAISGPDLIYTAAMATKANTNGSQVRLKCVQAIQDLNKQISGTGLVDSTGAPLTMPTEPHIFTDLEMAAEGIDALSPTGPLFTSCAGAAALAGMNVLAFINAMVAGTAAAAIVVPK